MPLPDRPFRVITVAERTLDRAISGSNAVVGKYLQPYVALRISGLRVAPGTPGRPERAEKGGAATT
ncbi:hypothetical protein ACFVIZ_09160 [Streptomyces anulatus]|uniref:hypothetical protein n=1 Tax=Streptomyces anulatus TaxID=1892 RepID=UPI003642CB53